MSVRRVTREQFDEAADAVWAEIQYQNTLKRRTPWAPSSGTGEAVDVPAFLTLLRVYTRRVEDIWADNPAPVEQALHGMRKLAAIGIRAMVYTGIRWR